jgi:23S rRNA (adenine2503-C2)-methyltransferase
MADSFPALSMDALAERLGSRTRAAAARRWLYAARPVPATPPARIPGVTPRAWAAVREGVAWPEFAVRAREVSPEGTVKLALDLAGATVETVLIPARGRSTVCVSSQAGCTRACLFCATATLGFARHLDAGEIVLQYVIARAEAPADAPARNVVFMGMGEPMDNLDAVMTAIDRLLESPEPRLSPAHVTVSTSGVLPGMRRFLAEGRGHLALSLNATTDAQREGLMPHTRTWPIGDLLDVLRADARVHPGRRYFVEYVLWAGVNDTAEDAARLAALLRDVPAHVNLIPHNRFSACDLQPPDDATVRAFQKAVAGGGVRCLVRWPRGREIAAACGQLARGQVRTSRRRLPS